MTDYHHTFPDSGHAPARPRARWSRTGVWLGLALALTALQVPAQGWRHGHAGAAGAAVSPPCRPTRGGPWGSGYGWRMAAAERAASAPVSAASQAPVTAAAAAQGSAAERDAVTPGRRSALATDALPPPGRDPAAVACRR